MNKTEAYYKFIFPTYDSLSGKDSDSIPTSDGDDQISEVRSLCRSCPNRVITYDQLNNTLKGYIDEYLSLPKYFNLRNYWDARPCQEGGMSLIVSHTPEIGSESSRWTKIHKNGKSIYFSLVISSGDFFYCFCLPDEVITKSKLRDNIVSTRFHSNWYFSSSEKYAYFKITKAFSLLHDAYPDIYDDISAVNPVVGSEKRVFVQPYFSVPGIQYGRQSGTLSYIYYKDNSGNTYRHRETSIYYSKRSDPFSDLNPIVPDCSSASYIKESVIIGGSTKEVTIQKIDPTDDIYYYIKNTNSTITKLTRFKYYYTSGLVTNDYITLSDGTRIKVDSSSVVEEYSEISEDLKRDYIDLESSRRILYYYNGDKLKYNNNIVSISATSSIPIITDPIRVDSETGEQVYEVDTTDIPVPANMTLTHAITIMDRINKVVSKSGVNTKLSYERPQEYASKQPLQIPYNILRYSLNDRPPFSDCETVLIMWVADSDPLEKDSSGNDVIQDGDVQSLHNLNWQQYAIPISIRCKLKDDSINTDRFLVIYPHGYTSTVNDDYGFHIRCAEKYNNQEFKEVLYLKDLVKYSSDYVVSFHHTKYYNSGFDVQKYLFKNLSKETTSSTPTSFKELYIKKAYVSSSYNREQQFYYIKVDKSDERGNKIYDINTSDSNLSSCIVDGNNHNNVFKPSSVLTREKYSKWDFDDTSYGINNDWFIRDDTFICLFDARDSAFREVSGVLSLVNSSTLRSFLQTTCSRSLWDDIYISSLGISPTNQTNNDFLKLSGSPSGDVVFLPIGILDGYIKIGNTIYGSTKNNTVIVSFKDIFDYVYDDYHHFHYNSSNNTYELTNHIDYVYTAYTINYKL